MYRKANPLQWPGGSEVAYVNSKFLNSDHGVDVNTTQAPHLGPGSGGEDSQTANRLLEKISYFY